MPVTDVRESDYPRSTAMSLTDRTYLALKDDILKARRRPESVLMESELAVEYGVSKTPIREALRLLVNEGWVIVIPRKGYFVRPLQVDDVREVFGLRQMIEPGLAAAAAKRATSDDLDALDRHVDLQCTATNTEAALDAAAAFHLGIARLAGNARAERVLQNVVDEGRRIHYLFPGYDSRLTEEPEVQDHRNIVTAMRQQDLRKLQDIMEQHSQESLRRVLDNLAAL